MKTINKKISRIIQFIENNPIDFKSWLAGFFAIISARLFVEAIVLGFPKRNLEEFIALFWHTFLFFLLAYLIFLFSLKFFLKTDLKKIANILLYGFWAILLPPVVDKLIFADKDFKSFYIFDGARGLLERFFLFFGSDPHWGITWGTRVEVVLVLVLIFVYVFYKKRDFLKAFIFTFFSYCIFYILGVFPSLIGLVLNVFSEGGIIAVKDFDIAAVFMTPFSFFGIKGEILNSFLPRKIALIYSLILFLLLLLYQYKENIDKFSALFRNIRFPQMIFNFGLLFIGLGLGWFYYKENFNFDFFAAIGVLNLMVIIFSAWFFSVFVNDLFDYKTDKISNKNRPLTKKVFSFREYADYSLVFLFFSLILSLIISPVLFLIIIFYHFLTWVYSAYPFRFKRFFGISNLISAGAPLLFLMMGFLVFSGGELLNNFPWRLIVFFFLAYFCVLPIKDLKDVEGDKKDGVYTLPVLLGREKTRFLLASLILLFYLASVYVVNEAGLFLPAVIFGSISFFVLTSCKVKETDLIKWSLLPVFLYGAIGMWIIFT